jgi:hypothetical protein
MECRSGFLGAPCIFEQSDQPQADASGLEAAAHLVGKLVVNCEHDSVSFRDASDVPGTLRSPWSGCLIHKESGGKQRCQKSDAPCDESLRGGEYAMKGKL